ncbi:hypothetical protein CANMA_001781 [Candida margitis]|uniref:uncharacterized protein n=1 Tax=Candida margitis TaxID=1775924 RepID=UPI002225EC1F|nr:uncharacterized protein CANMA_001781 [Candida margitis]KAI5969114.1 hypothetical protein CANMA_001781 [Candida margitis]
MSSHNPRLNYKHPSGLPTLLHLSQRCIKRHISQLQDVGTTPYHLLASVLSLMSAKQLGQLESLSTQLTPHSDELWKQLIIKDFPDRPAEIGPLELSKLKFEKMPYKSLYYKYVSQRDEFRKDSAKRLRHLNQSMNKEKAKNKIVAVDEIRRDPSVRSRSPFQNGFQRQTPPINKNTILGKAIRESQNRSLIFGTHAMRRYNPYSAFKNRDFAPIRAPRSSTTTIRRTTFFDQSRRQPATPPKSSTAKMTPIKGKQASPSPPSSPDGLSNTLKKKRIQSQPSIFLQNKRHRPPSRTSPIRKPKEQEKEATEENPSKIKPLKSSIFS